MFNPIGGHINVCFFICNNYYALDRTYVQTVRTINVSISLLKTNFIISGLKLNLFYFSNFFRFSIN